MNTPNDTIDDEGLVCLTRGQVERLRMLVADQVTGQARIIAENTGIQHRMWRVHKAEESVNELRKIHKALCAFMSRAEIRKAKQQIAVVSKVKQ